MAMMNAMMLQPSPAAALGILDKLPQNQQSSIMMDNQSVPLNVTQVE